ncbi:MAG: AIM24 family protein [Bacteroidota bacterium]
MAFCSNCGTRLIEGTVFCPECGTRNSTAGAPAPPAQTYAPPQQAAYQPPPQVIPQQPAKAPVRSGSLKFEVIEKETLKFLKAEFDNSAVRYESGGMYYMQGDLELEANLPSAGGFLKAMVTRESVVKPVISGSGTVWFEPSFGNFTIMDLHGEEWILDKGVYFASEMGIEIGSYTNKSISGFFSGEGFFQTKVSGSGKVVILSNGPLETVELANGKLVVDGSFAVARQASVQLSVAKANKGIFGSVISGEGIVNTFTGTGKVLIAPATNKYITMINYLSSIHHRVMQIKNS